MSGRLSLLRRNLQPEVMDQPDLDHAAHSHALDSLALINRVSSSAGMLWPPIARLAGQLDARPLSILDLASGGGDVAIGLWRRAKRAGIQVTITGLDVSPFAVEHAQERAAAAGAQVTFAEGDALADAPLARFDVVYCSLFLHHLAEDQAARFLRRMAATAQHLVLVNDLVRSPTGYAIAWAATRVLTRSPVVRVDGPRSVANAFSIGEVGALAERAGLTGAKIQRRWPWRFLLSWTNQPERAP